MAIEIERRFFVNDKFKELDLSVFKKNHYTQGYLSLESSPVVRVRLTDTSGYITIKGKKSGNGLGCLEFEYSIPKDEAEKLLKLAHGYLINKVRYIIPNGELKWEVDIFEDGNSGLTIAEIEIPTEDTKFEIPEWIGEEITSIKEYSNFELSKNPMNLRNVNKIPDNVYAVVRKLVVEHVPEHTSIVLTDDLDLRLAYLDSLDLVDIIMSIEDYFEIEIPTNTLPGVNSIRGLIEVTNNAIKSKQ